MTEGTAERLREWASRHAGTVNRTEFAQTLEVDGSGLPAAVVLELGPGPTSPGIEVLASGTLADGRTLIAAGYDNEVRVWDLSGALVSRLPARVADGGLAFAQLPGGRLRLATLSPVHAPSVRFWDPETGRQLRTIERGNNSWLARLGAGVLPDGRALVAGGDADGVHVWDATGALVHNLPLSPASKGTAVAFGRLPDGRPVLAAMGGGDDILFWDALTGSPLRTITDDGSTQGLALGSTVDGRCVLASATGSALSLWDAATGVRIRALPEWTRPPSGYYISRQKVALVTLPGGNRLAVAAAQQRGSGGSGHLVVLWDVDTGERVVELPHPVEATAVAPVVTADGVPMLATGGRDGVVRLWRLPGTHRPLWTSTAGPPTVTVDGDPRVLQPAGYQDEVWSLCFTELRDGGLVLASSADDGSVRFWDPLDGHLRRQITGSEGRVVHWLEGASFGQIIGSANNGGTSHVWDAASGELLVSTAGDGDWIGGMAIDPATGRRFQASTSGRVIVTNANTRRHRELTTDGGVYSVAVARTRDGATVVASGGGNGTVQVWDLDSGVVRLTVEAPGEIRALAIGLWPDGRTRLVAGEAQGNGLEIWDLTDGTRLHGTPIGDVSDAQTLLHSSGVMVCASTGYDGVVRLWDLATGQPLVEVTHARDRRAISVALRELPDGRVLLASGGADGAVRVWTVRVRGAQRVVERDWAAYDPSLRAAATGVAVLSTSDICPPLSMLADLVALIGGRQPKDGRLTAVYEDPGVGRLRELSWRADARVGLAALLVADLPVVEEWRPPEGTPAELLGALLAALRADPAASRAYPVPTAELLAAAESIGEQMLALLTVLGPDAVAADPLLPLRLRDQATAFPMLDAPQRKVVTETVTVTIHRGRMTTVRRGPIPQGIARQGRLPHMLPTQLALPADLFSWRLEHGELLYRQYEDTAFARLEPVTIVLDTTPATFGPVEKVLRLVAHVITTTMWAASQQPHLVTLDRAGWSSALSSPADLASIWTARTLDRPALDEALATAALCGAPSTVVLTEHHLARDHALRPHASLRLLTTHVPGDAPRRPPVNPYHLHLGPRWSPAELGRAVTQLIGGTG